MPDIASIHHVSFTVTDLDRSVAWYKEALASIILPTSGKLVPALRVDALTR